MGDLPKAVLRYQEWIPSADLFEFVQFYYFIQGDLPKDVSAIRSLFPDRRSDFIFNFQNDFHYYSQVSTKLKACHIYTLGPQVDRSDVTLIGKVDILGVALKDGVLPSLLMNSMNEIKNSCIDLADGFPKIFSVFEPVLESYAGSSPVRVSALEIGLRQLFHPLRGIYGSGIFRIENILEKYLASYGSYPTVEELASLLNSSSRQLNRNCLEYLGYSPKKFISIHRLNRAIAYLDQTILLSPGASQREDLTTITHNLGYFDQAHFCNEFKKFTSLSPREYRAERLQLMSENYNPSAVITAKIDKYEKA